MRRESLIDFFDTFSGHASCYLVHDDGYRDRRFGYDELADAARRFAHQLEREGLGQGDHVVFWSENRPGWIIAFWGCVLRGVVVVPVDYHASPDFLNRVAAIVEARVVLAGEEVDTGPVAHGRLWPLKALEEPGAAPPPAVVPCSLASGDVAEIIFTSGATAEPKGVVITHGNILANIVPVEREVRRYRRWARPFAPIRFLNLLPLSHMFGQAMAIFVPPMLSGTVVFMRGFAPGDIVGQIAARRVSVLVSVPKILGVLADHVRRRHPEVDAPAPAGEHWLKRWWRFRAVHRAFGWKFWSFVVGAAPLDQPLEEFWRRLGFLVVQGYGLTETAPIVTLNHPFATRSGSVGRPIAGVEVKIAPDGEILVRGENVTKGYFRAPDETARAFEDGWLHTGDVGGFDDAGRLYIRGRKKEMIVTPEGLNVFPEDVERVLNALDGVEDSAVVGRTWNGEERVHAVLVLAPGVAADEIVRRANATLGDHQRIRSVSVWPVAALPRTEGTRKLRRREIRRWVETGGSAPPPAAAAGRRSLEAVVARFSHASAPPADDTTLDELGLSSLERVELLMALEEAFETTIDETVFASARSVADLRRIVEPVALTGAPGVQPAGEPAAAPLVFPAWNRGLMARWLRRLSLDTWVLPLARLFIGLRVDGLDHLAAVDGPVIFAANHQSHFDTPAVLMALPQARRHRVAVAMAKEFFAAHFAPAGRPWRAVLTNRINYVLAALYFNAFPLPQREVGTRQTLRYVGDLVGDGYSVLIFPEGRRTDRGEIAPFRQGVAMVGSRLGVPIVPIRLDGLDRILHHSWKRPRRGRAAVIFGRPIVLADDDYVEGARRIEHAVRALGPGAPGPADS